MSTGRRSVKSLKSAPGIENLKSTRSLSLGSKKERCLTLLNMGKENPKTIETPRRTSTAESRVPESVYSY